MALPRRAKPTLGFLDQLYSEQRSYNGEGLLVSSDRPFYLHNKWLERRAFGHALGSDSDDSELVAFEPKIRAHEDRERLNSRGKLFWCLTILYNVMSLGFISIITSPTYKHPFLYLLGLGVLDRLLFPVYTYLFSTPLEKRLGRKRKAREYTKKTALHRSPDRLRVFRDRKVHRNLYDKEDHPDWQPRRFWHESLDDAFPHWCMDISILVKSVLVVVRDYIKFELTFQLFVTIIQTLGVHFYHGEDLFGIFQHYWNNIIQSMLGVQGLGALVIHYKVVFGWLWNMVTGNLDWIPRTINNIFWYLGISRLGFKRWLRRLAYPGLDSQA